MNVGSMGVILIHKLYLNITRLQSHLFGKEFLVINDFTMLTPLTWLFGVDIKNVIVHYVLVDIVAVLKVLHMLG